MPRVCTVCAHDSRDTVDRAIIAGQPMSGIARQYGLGEDAVRRHRAGHLSPAIAKVEAERGSRLLNRVEQLITRTESILTTAEESGRVSVALQAVRELRELLRLLGNASGELDERPSVTVNLLASPEWLTVRSRIVAALEDHPAARAAVAAALAGVDDARPTEPLRLGSTAASVGPTADR